MKTYKNSTKPMEVQMPKPVQALLNLDSAKNI